MGNDKPKESMVIVWTDASLRRNKAGGAYVVANSYGDGIQVSAFSLHSSNEKPNELTDGEKITKSTDAELWTALIALENARPGAIAQLVTDCMFVCMQIRKVREGKLDSEKYKGPLYERFAEAVKKQPDMEALHLKRNKEHIHLADIFADAAAHMKPGKVHEMARQYMIKLQLLPA